MVFSLVALSSCIDIPAARIETEEELEKASLEGDSSLRAVVLRHAEAEDLAAALFADEATSGVVVDFFAQITRSRRISLYILRYAAKNRVSPFTAFALAWVESKYDPRAVNRNVSSVDRGLFQLNSASFPNLEEHRFFDPEVSARYGLAYFRMCLDRSQDEIVALAMYNAGQNRVAERGAPRSTLYYISKFVSYRQDLEQDFNTYIAGLIDDPSRAQLGDRVFLDIRRSGK